MASRDRINCRRGSERRHGDGGSQRVPRPPLPSDFAHDAHRGVAFQRVEPGGHLQCGALTTNRSGSSGRRWPLQRDAQVLARYQRWRSIDALSVSVATDTLNRLFAIAGKPARAVRRFGLGAVQKIKPLKSLFMAEARGESGTVPKLLQGVGV